MSSKENLALVSAESQSSKEESSPICGSETGFTSSKTHNGASSESSNGTIDDAFPDYGLRNVERSGDRISDRASASFKEQPCQESVSANSRGSLDAADKVDDSINNGLPSIGAEDIHSSSVPRRFGNLSSVAKNHKNQ
ncbi:hypothetical protein L1049_015334 [Liquidambar formosana]|uniref:Uncharacterized protein n=1 Tax=Liquidambar formosana TaxID=63359 RepID=A0AAP0RXR2_LIQFO